jgi:hypothetical protein
MVNLIQPITVQQAYDGITHERRRASWNWWWRMVGDDDGVDFPSPEPKTDPRSALPRKNRRWRRLRIVKRDELFSLIFSPRIGLYGVGVEVGGVAGGPQATWARPRGGGRPLACGQVVDPLRLILLPVFFINSKNILHKFSGQSENFYFCTKITPRQFCWKQR